MAAPHAATTMSAAKLSVWPSRSTTTAETSFPEPFVSSLTTLAFVSSVTFGCSSAGRTPSTSASDFACTRQGNPSQVVQRMQWLYGRFVSVSLTPHGAWNGWWPAASRSSESCWIRGSCVSAGNGYGALDGGSVGSSPRAPWTSYSCSARV